MSYVCVCVCVCVCVHVSTSLESPPIMENLRCDYLCLIDFILFRHLKQNGLEP